MRTSPRWPCSRSDSSNSSTATAAAYGTSSAGLQHHLLAHVLRGELALGLVGQDVRREERLARLRHEAGQRGEQRVDVLARERRRTGPPRSRRAGPGRRAMTGSSDSCGTRSILEMPRTAGLPLFAHLLDDPARRLADLDLPSRAVPASTRSSATSTSERVPRATSTMRRFRGPWARWSPGVSKKRELRPLAVPDAEDAGARGLRARRDDGDVLAQDAVEERRLADVGPADDGDEAGAERCCLLAVMRCRARRAERAGARGFRAEQGCAPRVMVIFSSFALAFPAAGDLRDELVALHHLAEDGVPAVQVRGRRLGDEELASRWCSGRRWPWRGGPGLSNLLSGAESRPRTVAGAARAGAERIAALDHEVRDDAVEDRAVVERPLTSGRCPGRSTPSSPGEARGSSRRSSAPSRGRASPRCRPRRC